MWPSVAQHGYYNFCHMARWAEGRKEGWRVDGSWRHRVTSDIMRFWHKMAFLKGYAVKNQFWNKRHILKGALKHPVGMQRSSVHNDEGMMKPGRRSRGENICVSSWGELLPRRKPTSSWEVDHFWFLGISKNHDCLIQSPLSSQLCWIIEGLKKACPRLRDLPLGTGRITQPRKSFFSWLCTRIWIEKVEVELMIELCFLNPDFEESVPLHISAHFLRTRDFPHISFPKL